MSVDPTATATTRKLKRHRRLSLIMLVLSLALMARQMYFDDEPGAIPLLLVLISISWYFITRSRIRSQQRSV